MRALIVILLLIPACQSRAAARQLLPIGSACDGDSRCGTGRFAPCAQDPPAGYCGADCRSDIDCPAASVCVGASTLSSGVCHLACDGNQGCRGGYVCGAADAS